uniref:Uncharacterized protein n=1 Tax=Panagrolaimus sp. ES5 TaxID=591445 RepID=A0AC34GMQ8_9BILA
MNAMLDPRAFIPFLYDPTTLSMIQQQQQQQVAALAAAAAQSKSFSLPTNNNNNASTNSTSSISNASSTASASSSFRIHDLLDASKMADQTSSTTPNNSIQAALAQMMGAAFPSGVMPSGPGLRLLNSSISDQANSSGENGD